MPKEYSKIKDSLRKAHPDWSAEKVAKVAAMTFSDTFGISPQKAEKLASEGQWETWKKRRGFGSKKSHVLVDSDLFTFSEEVKAYTDEHGRYIQFDLAVADLDGVGDEMEPECIKSIENQLMGQTVGMVDPEWIPKSMHEVIGASKGGLEHEHAFLSKDIVPVTTITEVKNIGNRVIRCIAKVNEHCSRANNFWNMIQEKILTHASIEYKAMDWHYKEVKGKLVRVLSDLALTGYAWTSKPAQRLAGVATTFVKSMPIENEENQNNEKEVKTMSEEENKPPEVEDGDAKVPEDSGKEEAGKETAAPSEENQEEVKALKDALEEKDKEIEEIKSKLEGIESDEKIAKAISEQVKAILQEKEKESEVLAQKEKETADEVKSIIEDFHSKPLDERWAQAATTMEKLEGMGAMDYHAKLDQE